MATKNNRISMTGLPQRSKNLTLVWIGQFSLYCLGQGIFSVRADSVDVVVFNRPNEHSSKVMSLHVPNLKCNTLSIIVANPLVFVVGVRGQVEGIELDSPVLFFLKGANLTRSKLFRCCDFEKILITS